MAPEKLPLTSRVGEVSSRRDFVVTAERIAEFRRAVGAEHGADAPPTFLTILREGEFELFDRLGVPLKSVLHGEQVYVYGQPIRAGDHLSYETILTQVAEKRDMHFLTFETRVVCTSSAGRTGLSLDAGTARSVIVARGQQASGKAAGSKAAGVAK